MECRRAAFVALIAAWALAVAGCDHSGSEQVLIPWAWERREDLRFAGAGEIAYLCATIELRGEQFEVMPRLQPLNVNSGALLIPVFRLEARGTSPRVENAREVAAVIARLASRDSPRLVQIDFDATESQRVYYAALLGALRKFLPRDTRISITALSSWCMTESWLSELPIDEAVPMVFRMGAGSVAIRRRLERGDDFPFPLCRSSIGISTDEPLARAPYRRRVYVFHPASWNERSFDLVAREVRQWH